MIDEILAKLPEGVFTLRDRVEQIVKLVRVDINSDLVAALEREHALQQKLDDLNVKFGALAPAENPTTRKFKSEYLLDELELPSGDGMIKTWVIEEQDHLTLHGLIFSDEEQPSGYAWQTTFTTSNDDDEGGPWEHESEVECTLVKLVPKMSKAWIPAVMPESCA